MEETRTTQFFLPIAKIPSGTAQQRKTSVNYYTGKIQTRPSDSYIHAKRVFCRLLLPHKPSVPFMGPLKLEIGYRYEAPTKKMINTFKTTRPDGDNLLKVFKDCLNNMGFFAMDDSQVASETITRYYVEKGKGGIYVKLSELKNEVM